MKDRSPYTIAYTILLAYLLDTASLLVHVCPPHYWQSEKRKKMSIVSFLPRILNASPLHRGLSSDFLTGPIKLYKWVSPPVCFSSIYFSTQLHQRDPVWNPVHMKVLSVLLLSHTVSHPFLFPTFPNSQFVGPLWGTGAPPKTLSCLFQAIHKWPLGIIKCPGWSHNPTCGFYFTKDNQQLQFSREQE